MAASTTPTAALEDLVEDRGLAPYRESVEMARAELLDALTSTGTTPERARHLVDTLASAVRDLAVSESVDATEATLSAVAPCLGYDPVELVGMVDRAGFRDDDSQCLPHVVSADQGRN